METDKGSSDQAKTPFNVDQTHLTYNISLTQIAVDENITKISTNVIFYSGTSFIYLIDLAYSVMVENVFILQIFTPAPSAFVLSLFAAYVQRLAYVSGCSVLFYKQISEGSTTHTHAMANTLIEAADKQ